MTSAVLNLQATTQNSWIATAVSGIGTFFADWSSRNAANDDVAHFSAHQLEDIGLTAADTQPGAGKALWSAL